jgi:rhodanese-related sulfurtransferase
LIIAVDFDNTLAFTDYPDIRAPNQPVIDYIKAHKLAGDTIILYTCRHGQSLNDAVAWCREQGIVFDYINENAKELVEKYGDCRKVAADVYIDDKNLLVSEIREENHYA